MSKCNSTSVKYHNQVISSLSSSIEEFEKQNNVILFDDERIQSLPANEIKLIDELNATINPLSICKESISAITKNMLTNTPERIFFESLISNQ